MLVLAVNENEDSIIIDTPQGKIRIKVTRVSYRKDTKKNQIRIGFDAPREIPIYREEFDGHWKGTASEPGHDQSHHPKRN